MHRGDGKPHRQASFDHGLICDKDTCFQPKMIDVEAPLKILDGPAVPVEKAYLKEVEKALKK